jgi:hypothetical protein
MTDDIMQSCLEAGNMGGTPSEVRAIELAFEHGREQMLGEVLAELDAMHSSMSAYDAAVDIRHIYESLPAVVARVTPRHGTGEDK